MRGSTSDHPVEKLETPVFPLIGGRSRKQIFYNRSIEVTILAV